MSGHPADSDGDVIFTVGALLDALADVPRSQPIAVLARPRDDNARLSDFRSFHLDTSRGSVAVLEPLDGKASALAAAVELGDLASVRRLVDAGHDVNQRDRRGVVPFDGETPLISAANRGSVPIIQLLLDLGADVNARSLTGWTALMRACNAGKLEASQCLLQAGADPSITNDEGYTAKGRIPGTHPELLALLDKAEDAYSKE